MLKVKDLSEIERQKAEDAARKERAQRRLYRRLFHLQNTVLCPSLGD